MIDTNVLLDWLLDRHPERTAVAEKLFKSGRFVVVPEIVIAELVFALQKFYLFTRPEVVAALTAVIEEPAFLCHRSRIARAAAVYVAHPSLSFVDCYQLEIGQDEQLLPLFTFDKKLVNQSGGRAKLLR